MRHNKVAPATEKGVLYVGDLVNNEELKTKPELIPPKKKNANNNISKQEPWYTAAAPTVYHYIVLLILGLLTWGCLWLSWGDGWRWDGQWFRLVIVVVTSWACGLVLTSITTLPPVIGSLVVGILARNLGYLDMRDFTHIDGFLRKIYPVIILGKGSLGWDMDYMMANWKQVVALGVIPWTAEVATLATCMHYFLGHPWLWGLVLGTFYASLSVPVVMPNVLRVGMSPRRNHNWPQLVATAGGTDTALSVGVYGVLFGYLFSEPGQSESYRYFKAFSALFIGVGVGVAWGCLSGLIPHSKDPYVVELRVLFVLFGGIFLNFATSYVGWGGVVSETAGPIMTGLSVADSVLASRLKTVDAHALPNIDLLLDRQPTTCIYFLIGTMIAVVAVLACNATAARQWAKKGWALNNNPASTAYRVMWSACEPTVFAYTGTFFVIDSTISRTLLYGLATLLICLTVRLTMASLMSWNYSIKEKAFICCVWSTKSIVEAVICPSAINILLERGGTADQMRYAEDFVILTVQEILVTTPIAFLLTRFLGPILIKDKERERNESTA